MEPLHQFLFGLSYWNYKVMSGDIYPINLTGRSN